MQLNMRTSVALVVIAVIVTWTLSNHEKPAPIEKRIPAQNEVEPSILKIDKQPDQLPIESSPVPDKIKPETIVRFREITVICATPRDLIEVYGHIFRGELTKANAMVGMEPQLPCMKMDPTIAMKVIAASYSEADPSVGVLEVVNPGSGQAKGLFAYSMTAYPVKQ